MKTYSEQAERPREISTRIIHNSPRRKLSVGNWGLFPPFTVGRGGAEGLTGKASASKTEAAGGGAGK